MKWTEKYRVNAQDIDMNKIVSASGIQRYMQDCANLAMAGDGPSYDELYANGYSFVLSRIRTSAYAPIYAHDEIEVSTWACESRGVIFPRCYQIKRDGVIIAEARSDWALLNLNTHRFTRVSEIKHNYCKDEMLELDMQSHFKLPADVSLALVGERTTEYADVDRNRHLNNAHYPDILCSFIPNFDNMRVICSEISFVTEAPLGDTLKFYHGESDGIHYIRSVRPDGKVNVEAEFVLEAL